MSARSQVFGHEQSEFVGQVHPITTDSNTDRIEKPVHHLEVAGHRRSPDDRRIPGCGRERGPSSRHLVAIAQHGGVGEGQEFTAGRKQRVGHRVHQRPKVVGSAGLLGAHTEHATVGQQSEEALVEERGSSGHVFHLGAVQAPVGVDIGHFLDRQVERTVQIVHCVVLGRYQTQRVGRRGGPDGGHPTPVHTGRVVCVTGRCPVDGLGDIGESDTDPEAEGVHGLETSHEAEQFDVGDRVDAGSGQLFQMDGPDGVGRSGESFDEPAATVGIIDGVVGRGRRLVTVRPVGHCPP